MKQDLIIKDAQLVLADEVVRGTIAIAGEHIAAINTGTTAVSAIEDLEGDLLLPGLVELHTDNFERHLMPRPKVNWASMPALLAHDAEVSAAGITTVFDALGVGDIDEDALRGKGWADVLACFDRANSQELLRAEHHLHVRCELPAPNSIEVFEPFAAHDRLALISLMDHTPGQRQWENIEQARIYYTGKKGWTQQKFERQVAEARELQERYALPHRQYFVEFCRNHGIALASHDDTTPAHVQQAHAEGAQMSEFPTTVAAAAEARKLEMDIIMGAPNVVRGGSHSGNVAAAELARLGLLDILSSDYVPGSLLMAAFRLTQDAQMSVPKAIATVTSNPAKSVGMNDRGSIAPEMRADLIQVRMVDTPEGQKHPVVRAVWRQGRRVA